MDPTIGRKSSEAANRGTMGIHKKGCKARIEKAISVREPDGFDKIVTKLSIHELRDPMRATKRTIRRQEQFADMPNIKKQNTARSLMLSRRF